MGGTENKQLLQRIFEELSKGNSEPLRCKHGGRFPMDRYWHDEMVKDI